MGCKNVKCKNVHESPGVHFSFLLFLTAVVFCTGFGADLLRGQSQTVVRIRVHECTHCSI
jgi:hypothetical protein